MRDELGPLVPGTGVLAVDEVTRRTAIFASPIDYGAAGDGSTNDYTALDDPETLG